MVAQLKEDKARAEETVEKQAAELTALKAELNELALGYKVCSHYAVYSNTASVGFLMVLVHEISFCLSCASAAILHARVVS
jgi:hypothetical protein